MKIEIYQIGKVPPLTVVKCDYWKFDITNNVPIIRCMTGTRISAMFILNNIAGFKEVVGEG